MILVHLINIIGFVLLFFFPIGTVIGVLLLISTGAIYALRDKFDKREYKRTSEQIQKHQRLNRLENSLDDIENEYFESGKAALRQRSTAIYHYEIGTLSEYQDACRELSREIVEEIQDDWELVEREISEQEDAISSAKVKEAKNHRGALASIVQEATSSTNLKADEVTRLVHEKYSSLNMPKGVLTIRKMRGSWRVKVQSDENPHLELDFTV